MTVCPAMWVRLPFFFMVPILVVRGPGCRWRELRWLYPCVQSGVGSVSWQYITLLILLHGLCAGPTCWDAFNSCADFDLFFFFPGISGFYLWPVQETAQTVENICALLMPAIWWLILRYIFSWFLWYIQHHNPHMAIASLCIPVGFYLLLFKDLPQRLSLAEQHCVPGSSNHPP